SAHGIRPVLRAREPPPGGRTAVPQSLENAAIQCRGPFGLGQYCLAKGGPGRRRREFGPLVASARYPVPLAACHISVSEWPADGSHRRVGKTGTVRSERSA